MKRKVLSAALAATLMLSSVVPSFAEELVVPDIDTSALSVTSANPDFALARTSVTQPSIKSGKQKVLCVMINMENLPFEKDHNEKFYYEQLFGKSSTSLKNYVNNQSNGHFNIEPADTIKSKYPGIVKINAKVPQGYTANSTDYTAINQFVKNELQKVANKVDCAACDKNGDKRFHDFYARNSNNYDDELVIMTVISGEAFSKNFRNPGKVMAWPHATMLNTNINGYSFNHATVIMSELTRNGVVNSATFAHEFMHNIGARDMYLHEDDIDFWSLMARTRGRAEGKTDYSPIPLDPAHKLFFGWKKPKKVKFNDKGVANIKVNKNEVPYLVDTKNPNIIYLLDYHDLSEPSEKALNYHGIYEDGVNIWKINKNEARSDWRYDPYVNDLDINTRGKRSAMCVMTRSKSGSQSAKHSYTPVGSSRSIDGTLFKVDVRNKELVIHNRGV